ncbi:uromodulin-like [Hyperolius riggenbachi]|uniref:uromodulin-like n=1 Tax=Hyperolius riggenbachi TaxID=752182 RepID=UPI0035A2E76D
MPMSSSSYLTVKRSSEDKEEMFEKDIENWALPSGLKTMKRKKMNYVLSILCLAICLHLSDAQTLSMYAKACSNCNTTTSTNCAANSGYASCSCKPGYVGDGWNCTIMAFCNTYTCCPDGYTWNNDNKQCVDINECANPTLNKCSPTDTCVNRNGIHLCIINRKAPCGGPGSISCTSDQDCLRISGEAQCADPCYNYQQINGANRLANINSTGRFPNDRNLFGWYRYVGTGSSLKEGCVGPLKCGSLEPYTLGGIHPKIGDGIQMVPLQINSVASGCYNGSSIPVKACPGGYYVYKFSGALKFDVYCTGETTTPTTTTTTTPTTTRTNTPTTTTTTTPTTTTTTTPTTTTTTTPTTTTTTTPTTTTTTTPTTTRTTTSTTITITTPTTPTATTSTTVSITARQTALQTTTANITVFTSYLLLTDFLLSDVLNKDFLSIDFLSTGILSTHFLSTDFLSIDLRSADSLASIH